MTSERNWTVCCPRQPICAEPPTGVEAVRQIRVPLRSWQLHGPYFTGRWREDGRQRRSTSRATSERRWSKDLEKARPRGPPM